MHKVLEILKKKGHEVSSIEEGSNVRAAASRMNERRIGSLVVTRGEEVVGIVSERDILGRIVAAGRNPESTVVSEVMTTPVACCRSDTSLEECKGVMTELRVRHLPVVENGKLMGIITSGDIIAFEKKEQQHTIEYLYHYLYGTAPEAEK